VLDVYELTKATRVMVYHQAVANEAACVPGAEGCHWQFATGEGGYHYSMWSLSKGIGEYISPDLSNSSNYYAKIADLLVSQQRDDGSWPQDGRDDGSIIGRPASRSSPWAWPPFHPHRSRTSRPAHSIPAAPAVPCT
jgi:hypothetical protein